MIKKINIYTDLKGTVFPAGRHGRVIAGADSPLQADNYVVGTSDLFPGGGSVPEHDHETEETYIIISGAGVMRVDGESFAVEAGDAVYVKPWQKHGLTNTGNETLRIIYVYAPKMIVDHWAQELEGSLK